MKSKSFLANEGKVKVCWPGLIRKFCFSDKKNRQTQMEWLLFFVLPSSFRLKCLADAWRYGSYLTTTRPQVKYPKSRGMERQGELTLDNITKLLHQL